MQRLPLDHGPRGPEELVPAAAAGDHYPGAAAGGACEHAGTPAESDGQMLQEMLHQSRLLHGKL